MFPRNTSDGAVITGESTGTVGIGTPTNPPYTRYYNTNGSAILFMYPHVTAGSACISIGPVVGNLRLIESNFPPPVVKESPKPFKPISNGLSRKIW